MVDINEEYDLTIQQENIWLIEKLYDNTNINNVTGIFCIKQLLDLSIMGQVMNRIIENNDALRIRIKQRENHPIQYFCKYQLEDIPIYKVHNKKEVDNILEKIKLEKFNTLENKLYYIAVIQDLEYTYVCVKTHHIISDAWTLGQVAEQIKENYLAIKADINTKIKPSYKLHIKKDEGYRVSERFLRDREFWNEYIKDIESSSYFENVKNKESRRIEKKIPNKLFVKIEKYCKENKITEYVFFLTIISVYFMKIFGKEKMVLGVPFLNRAKKDKDLETMGMFIATLPIKIDTTKNMTFIELCKNVTNTNMACFKHSKYPYYEIQKQYQKYNNSNASLYEVAFSYQINKLEKEIDGDTGKTIWLHNNSQVNPMLISYVNHFGEHKIYYDYLIKLFQKQEISKIHDRIIMMIEKIIQIQDEKICNISILSNEDILLLKEFNNTGNIKNTNENIITRFEKIVKELPKDIAVKCGNDTISYSELSNKSDLVAINIINLGLQKNAPISIIFDKSINMIIAMLGIMKAGNYYIPILPEEEQKRAEYIVKNSDSKIIITDDKYTNKMLLDNVKVINIMKLIKPNEQKINIDVKRDDIAYMIYTSGTTGNPKGVMMQHQNINSLISSINKDKDLKFLKNDVLISLLKYSFDASAIDIYTSLLNGGKLILVQKEIELNPKEVVEIIQNENVTRCFTVHKWIEQIQEYGKDKKLKLRILGTGAEVLKPEKFKKILKNNKNLGMYNTYGPTETTMFVTKHKIDSKDIKDNFAPIGKLIPNNRAIVVNTNNEILPVNYKGELVIYEDNKSSQNISKGYYKLEDKTQKKYIELKLPYLKNKVRGYKTGDMVKVNNDLELEFLGRQDDFVKISGGYLVSLNEVEKTIQGILGDEFDICPLALNINNRNEIIVFIVKKGNSISIKKDDIEQIINANITFYMKPKYIIEIEELPRNKNGKIDREKMTEYFYTIFEKKDKVIKPTTKLEKFIYNKTKEIIEKDFSITDDFEDDLGLDSLNMTSLYMKLENDKLSIQDLYNYSTIQDLASMMQSEQIIEKNNDEKIEIFNNATQFDMSTIFLTGATGFLGANLLRELAYNPNTNKIYCLIRNKIGKTSEDRFKETINKYFNKNDAKIIKSKTIVINGDLTIEKFGLNNNIFNKLIKEITTIINSAANVKHIGKYKDFYKDNVLTVNNLIEISKKYHISLAHISTLSINGQCKNNGNINILDENVLNIGQTFDKNPYLFSKYEAEKKILRAIKTDNINAKIFRIGNIMPRIEDGIFQINYEQNAFLLAVKEIMNLKIQNVDLMNMNIYLTPADECSKAIINILNDNTCNNIYHIESDKDVKVSQIVNLLKKDGEKYKIANIEEFNNELYKNYNIGVEHLKSILNNKNNQYSKDITVNILKKEGFEWKKLDNNYLQNIIKIAMKIK